MAVAMRGEETAAVLPEPWPYALPVCLRDRQPRQGFTWEELKAPFAMRGRQRRQSSLYLEQEHQPMALALIAVLARQPGQVQVQRRKRQTQLSCASRQAQA